MIHEYRFHIITCQSRFSSLELHLHTRYLKQLQRRRINCSRDYELATQNPTIVQS